SSAASARPLEGAPSLGADGDAAVGSAEACFAALVAWLLQVSPAAGGGGAAEAVPGDRPAAGTPAIPRPTPGAPHASLVASGDAHGMPAGETLLARAVFSIASAETGAASAGPTAATLPEPSGESSARSSNPLDL